jgi:hypothetical protein
LPDSGLPAYVIDAPFLYQRDGNPYVGPDGHDWSDNHRRFALLGWVAAHLASGELDPDWVPDSRPPACSRFTIWLSAGFSRSTATPSWDCRRAS